MMNIREQLYPLKTQLLDLLCTASAGARHFNPEDHIIISSYPRSGSTWVAELISQMPGSALLWEPLHLRKGRAFADSGFGWRQHIPENEDWMEAQQAFEALFTGELLNHWMSSRTFPLKFCSADRMVIKFVRANGLLPWLTRQFYFSNKPIYLIRHPFAVAASQMKEGSWDEAFKQYSIPSMPYNGIYRKHESYLSSLNTQQEILVADWCINNKVVLDNERHERDWIAIHYEQLLTEPESVLQGIFDRWERPLPEGIFRQLQKASSTTVESTFQKSVRAQLGKWQHSFDRSERKRLQRVLNYFGVDIYSQEMLLPAV